MVLHVFTSISIFMMCILQIHTAQALCNRIMDHEFVSVEVARFLDADFKTGADSSISARQTRLDAALQIPSDTRYLTAGFSHEYRSVDFQGLTSEPQTNGDLHTLQLPLSWASNKDAGRSSPYRITLSPTIASSSNALKNPDQLTGSNLQLGFAAQRQIQWSPALTVLLGLCGDHRWGDYRVYPQLGVVWPLTSSAHLQLAYPDSRLTWKIASNFTFTIEIGPAGRQWYVYDKSFNQQSQLQWKAWELRSQWRWKISTQTELTLLLGQRFDQSIQFKTVDNGKVDVGLRDVNYGSIRLRWGW
ncbi:MAG: hypothetical protein MI864_09840 [Pseudomonadales bacterium]|nr:hypothetical protein [Pseudomonadales bacterium]